MEDNKFTNSENIEYPSLEEIADVRVINNNIKLIEEKKLDSEDLFGVAKERTEYSIEDKVNELWKLREHYLELPNLANWSADLAVYVPESLPLTLEVTGSGYLCAALLLAAEGEGNVLQIEIDGQMVSNLELTAPAINSTGRCTIGLANITPTPRTNNMTGAYSGFLTPTLEWRSAVFNVPFSPELQKKSLTRSGFLGHIIRGNGLRFESSLKVTANGKGIVHALYSLDN